MRKTNFQTVNVKNCIKIFSRNFGNNSCEVYALASSKILEEVTYITATQPYHCLE